jgi:hypothetical protein
LAGWSIELATMENSQSIKLTPSLKLSRHGKHKNPNYHREYYRQNKEKLLTYSHNYYGVKKLLKPCLKPKNKETKIGVKKISLTDARVIYSNFNIKEFVFFVRRLGVDKGSIRLETVSKIPQKVG